MDIFQKKLDVIFTTMNEYNQHLHSQEMEFKKHLNKRMDEIHARMDQIENINMKLNTANEFIGDQIMNEHKLLMMVAECLKIFNMLGFQDEHDRES